MSHDLLFKFWHPLRISETVGARKVKFGIWIHHQGYCHGRLVLLLTSWHSLVRHVTKWARAARRVATVYVKTVLFSESLLSRVDTRVRTVSGQKFIWVRITVITTWNLRPVVCGDLQDCEHLVRDDISLLISSVAWTAEFLWRARRFCRRRRVVLIVWTV